MTRNELAREISALGLVQAINDGSFDALFVPPSTGTGAVASVNGQVGVVSLAAADVGAATTAQGSKADTAVQTVNGKSGNSVTLNSADIGSATSSQGAKADTAVQNVNGKTGNSVTLAATDVGAATASQGTKADSAVQSVNGKTGTAVTLAATDVGAATTAQGAKADTAVQQIAGKSLSTNDYTTSEKTLLANKVSAASFRVCAIGTSLIQQNDVATAAKISHWNRGPISTARFVAKGLWDIVIWQDPTVRTGWEPSGTAGATRFFYGGNAGVSGQTIAQIQARIPTIISTMPNIDLYIFDGGTNDMSTLSKEDIHTARVATESNRQTNHRPPYPCP
jgi:hypothetical protein